MKKLEDNRIKTLLQLAFPPINDKQGTVDDLWPSLLKRMNAQPDMPPWFDWALLAALVGVAALFPTAIPIVLFYL